MPRPPFAAALLLSGALAAFAAPAAAQSGTPARVHDAAGWTEPGYYQFFHKTGELERLEAEVRRDEEIAAGQIAPERLDAELPDLSLPDTRGTLHSLRDRADGRRLVIVNFRTWW